MVPGMVKAVIEQTYDATCTVTEKVKTKVKGVVSYEDRNVIVDEPCRLSFSSSPSASSSEGVTAISQSIKLFVSPEVVIEPGAKIMVTRQSETTAYKCAGVSAKYETHQEIALELYEEYA